MRDFLVRGTARLFNKAFLFGLGSLVLYALLYLFEDFLEEVTARGRWYFLIPVGIAFLFSFVHGNFTAHFWDMLGVKARK